MRVAIHQPNLLPHERLLRKIAECDRFVILAHAQYEKGGYQNRFRHQERWYTLSVNRGLEPLLNKRYLDAAYDWRAIRRRLPDWPELDQFRADLGASVVATNVTILRRMLQALNITTEVVYDFPTRKTGTARLVELCEHYGATVYLSGPSGANYLDREQFPAANIHLEIQTPGPTRSGLEVLRDGL